MKLVKEHINEKFTDESDPIHDMGIGITVKIKKWLTENINPLDNHNNKRPLYIINDDITIDVNGNLAPLRKITKLPNYINFNIVYGFCDFGSAGLTSLKGFPKEVHGYFRCSNNKLTSLKGCPKKLIRDIYDTTGLPNFYPGYNPGKFTEKDVRQYCKQIDGQIYLD